MIIFTSQGSRPGGQHFVLATVKRFPPCHNTSNEKSEAMGDLGQKISRKRGSLNDLSGPHHSGL
jgi:hypothetical protein